MYQYGFTLVVGQSVERSYHKQKVNNSNPGRAKPQSEHLAMSHEIERERHSWSSDCVKPKTNIGRDCSFA
jgi:hypothetical protein